MDLIGWAVATVVSQVRPLGALGLLVVAVALYASAGLYRERLTLSALDDAPALVGRVLISGAVVMSVFLLVDGHVNSRKVTVATFTWLLLAVPLRALAYRILREMRRARTRHHPTLVIGAGRVGQRLARMLLEHPEYGMRPVGFLDDKPFENTDPLPVPLLENASLAAVIRRHRIRHVIIAFAHARESDMVDVVRQCDRLDCEVFLVPRLFELSHQSGATENLWGIPLSRLPRPAFHSPLWNVKRAVDVVLAAVALLLLAPVGAACAALTRLETGGVLFRQQRVGLDGKPFELLKFQSLRPATAEEGATLWNVKQDARLGPVGRFLRKTSLDELPQLLNILRGDMTLVGPRPERPFFVREFTGLFPHYMARHRVPAGLTGWAQIHDLRGDTSIEERARFDNFYIENWSLWGDVKILMRTLPSVLRGAGG